VELHGDYFQRSLEQMEVAIGDSEPVSGGKKLLTFRGIGPKSL
jgi:hypothetical protein